MIRAAKRIFLCSSCQQTNVKTFVQAVCEITNTNSPRKGKKPADKTIKRENYELRLADHTVQVFTNFIANFNHKNLVSDWVIEYMDRERYKRIVESDIGREDNDMTFVLTEAMTMPFNPTTACYLDKNSKYDRGHLAPALFHKEEEDTYKETFTMMNVAPQFDRFNRHVWANLEKVILSDFRNSEYEKMYIMTGPLYIEREAYKKQ
uniref:Extracellular Endonuclease subunit A domain-containing protein n=1 Tax=Romanomermis culicivorax TaxID=13658 RepID=A0A915K2A5_ROMCU